MSPFAEIRITVFNPNIDDGPDKRVAACQLLIESTAPLPHAPYAGTVRVSGQELTATGLHPCRLLKHFTVEHVEDTPSGTLYKITVDLTDERSSYSPTFTHNGGKTREVAESADVISKRIAGVFGRHCEQYWPPSVIVKGQNKDRLK